MRCANCGSWFIPTGRGDTDDEHCQACNDRFYAAMAAEYPYGQCWQCGARGWLWLCNRGRQHVVFNHVEGACSMWSDGPADEDGYCALCPAEARVPALVSVGGDDDLPF